MQENTSRATTGTNRAYRRAAEYRSSPSARYLTIEGGAEYLGVTTRTIREMISDGRLIGYRCGPRLVRVRRDEIDAAMRPFGGNV